MNKNSTAFGAPGIEPRWTSSAKDGVGTACVLHCFADAHAAGILNPKLRGKLRLHALLAPHLKRTGQRPTLRMSDSYLELEGYVSARCRDHG